MVAPALSPAARKWLTRVGVMLGIAGVVFVGLRLYGNFAAIDLAGFGPLRIAAILLLAGLYGVLNTLMAIAWFHILASLGAVVEWRWALRTYQVSQLAKYVPGNIFQFAGRQVLGVAAGLSNAVLLKSTAFELGLQVLAGCTFVPLLLPYIAPAAPWWCGIVGTLFFLSLLGWLAGRFGGPDLRVAVLAHAGFLTAAGLSFLAVASIAGVPIATGPLIPQAIGAYVIAWLIGLVTPGAPAGLGVREAVLLSLLSMLAPDPAIAFAIVLGRLATVGGDLAFYAAHQFITVHPIQHQT